MAVQYKPLLTRTACCYAYLEKCVSRDAPPKPFLV